jgi:hypothetical protein
MFDVRQVAVVQRRVVAWRPGLFVAGVDMIRPAQ